MDKILFKRQKQQNDKIVYIEFQTTSTQQSITIYCTIIDSVHTIVIYLIYIGLLVTLHIIQLQDLKLKNFWQKKYYVWDQKIIHNLQFENLTILNLSKY